MSLATGLAAAILLSLVLYALSGGADYGGGMWDLFSWGERAERQREAIEDAIAPIWEANHVWVILAVTILFTAFPPAFSAIMTALHVPLMGALLGIVFRGSAFVFRKYDERRDRTHRGWSRLFGSASLLTPFFLGVCVGALGSGEIRIEGGMPTTGFFAGWTSPFALACGLFAQVLFAHLAAVYLTVDTEGEEALQEDFRWRGLLSGVALVLIAAAVFLLARSGAPTLYRGLVRPWAPWLLLATAACAGGSLAGLALRRYRLARIGAVGEVALIVAGWGLAQYPHAVIPDLTFARAAAPPGTLRMLAWALALGAVLLFPAFAYLYRVFKPT